MNMISNNKFLQSVLESAAWKKISESETLSMEILEKYQDKLDWDEISENGNILWTVDGVKKFGRRINWAEFSYRCPDAFICEATLREFRDKWDWKRISDRDVVYNNWDLLDKFADDIDWASVITNWNIEKPEEFLNKFQSRIPMAKLQDSRLWDAMVDKRTKQLLSEVIGAK